MESADAFTVSEDCGAEAANEAVIGELGDKALTLEVDVGEVVVEAAVGVADDGSRLDGAEGVARPLVEDVIRSIRDTYVVHACKVIRIL